MSKKLLFIVNPVSGRGLYRRSLGDILHVFEENGCEVSAYMTEKRGDAAEMAAQLGPKNDLIVCMGGDGTLSETVNGLARIDFSVPLGYIPAGSTNDFAASLGISTDFLRAAEDIAQGTERSVDVMRIGERWFVNMANCGIFAAASYSAPQNMKNSLGQLAFFLNGIKDLSRLRAEHIRLTTNDDVYEDDYIFSAVCNSTALGGAFALPKGCESPDDGLFEALLIKKPNTLLDIQRTVLQLLGGNYPSEYIDFFQSDSVSIEKPVPSSWSVDGERLDVGTLVDVSVHHGKLRFVVCEDSKKESAPPPAWVGRWLSAERGEGRA